jgi:hypothetical protein
VCPNQANDTLIAPSTPSSLRSRRIGRVLTGLTAAFLLFDGGLKVVGHPEVVKSCEALGLPIELAPTLGVLMLACLALYLIPRTALLGAVLLTGYLGGAVLTHLRPARQSHAQKPDTPPPTQEKMAALGAFTQRNIEAGIVVMTGGLVRPNHGIHLRCEDGKVSITDGPFAESKELIDGFALVVANSKDEAVAIATSFMELAGDGTSEILQVFDGAEGAPPH